MMRKLIVDWVLNAEQKEDDNFDFLRKLKGYGNQDKVDKHAKEAHDYCFSCIDCTQCANCCKTISPTFTKVEVNRIADFKNVQPKDIIDQYLKSSEDDPQNFTPNALPCPFLDNNKCSIYDVCPRDCRDYPNTQKKNFTTRTYSHSSNTVTCPAVYHIVENLKETFNNSRRR